MPVSSEKHVLYTHFFPPTASITEPNGTQVAHWSPLLHEIAGRLDFSPEQLKVYLFQRGGGRSLQVYSHNLDEWEVHPSVPLFRTVLLDYYVRAVQLVEEMKMPEVGYSMDRRSLSTFAAKGGEDNVHALICFVCAQIWTDTTGSSQQRGAAFESSTDDVLQNHWYPPARQQVTEIRYYSVGQSLSKWQQYGKQSFASYMSLEKYKERYCTERHLTVPDVEWTRSLPYTDDEGLPQCMVLICCPEDATAARFTEKTWSAQLVEYHCVPHA